MQIVKHIGTSRIVMLGDTNENETERHQCDLIKPVNVTACLNTTLVFFKTFYDTVLAFSIFHRVVCWGSSLSAAGRKKLDKLIENASSVMGVPLDIPLSVLAIVFEANFNCIHWGRGCCENSHVVGQGPGAFSTENQNSKANCPSAVCKCVCVCTSIFSCHCYLLCLEQDKLRVLKSGYRGWQMTVSSKYELINR